MTYHSVDSEETKSMDLKNPCQNRKVTRVLQDGFEWGDFCGYIRGAFNNLST